MRNDDLETALIRVFETDDDRLNVADGLVQIAKAIRDAQPQFVETAAGVWIRADRIMNFDADGVATVKDADGLGFETVELKRDHLTAHRGCLRTRPLARAAINVPTSVGG